MIATNDEVKSENHCHIASRSYTLVYAPNKQSCYNHLTISYLAVVAKDYLLSDLALWWSHHSWSVMSREREVLALWRHAHRLFLHTQIGAKAIFTSE